MKVVEIIRREKMNTFPSDDDYSLEYLKKNIEIIKQVIYYIIISSHYIIIILYFLHLLPIK